MSEEYKPFKMNINKMLFLLNQAKSMGMTEIEVVFDTEARKFDYHYAVVGSMYLEPNYMENDLIPWITLHEEHPGLVDYPHDPRLEPGSNWDIPNKKQNGKNGWGFWNKDYTMWYGPWDGFDEAEANMKTFDETGKVNRSDA